MQLFSIAFFVSLCLCVFVLNFFNVQIQYRHFSLFFSPLYSEEAMGASSSSTEVAQTQRSYTYDDTYRHHGGMGIHYDDPARHHGGMGIHYSIPQRHHGGMGFHHEGNAASDRAFPPQIFALPRTRFMHSFSILREPEQVPAPEEESAPEGE